MGVFFNISFGPYEGAAWWRLAQDAAEDYSREASTSCPVLQHFLGQTVFASHRPEELGDDGFCERVLGQLWRRRAFPRKGTFRAAFELAQLGGLLVLFGWWIGWHLPCVMLQLYVTDAMHTGIATPALVPGPTVDGLALIHDIDPSSHSLHLNATATSWARQC